MNSSTLTLERLLEAKRELDKIPPAPMCRGIIESAMLPPPYQPKTWIEKVLAWNPCNSPDLAPAPNDAVAYMVDMSALRIGVDPATGRDRSVAWIMHPSAAAVLREFDPRLFA